MKFAFSLSASFGDLAAYGRARLKQLAYLARYLRQPLAYLERLPVDELALLAEVTSEIVAEENATANPLSTRANEG